MNTGKPRNRNGYTSEELLQVRSTCLRDPEHVGPQRAAEFDALRADDLDDAAADAHGYVDDLLRACARHGITTTHE